MIVFPDHKIVLYTPPRVASISLHMTMPRYGGILVYGPSGDDTGMLDQHTTWKDPAFSTWRRVIVTRDELDRLVSLYYLWKMWHPDCEDSFDVFVQKASEGKLSGWWFRWTIERWARPLAPYETIRYEHLEEDLSKLLGMPVQMAFHEHRSERKPHGDYYLDALTIKRARYWSKGCLWVKNRGDLVARFPKFGVGVEVGVFRGDFAEKLFQLCQPTVMYLVDHWLASIPWGPLQANDQQVTPGDAAYRNMKECLANHIISGRARVLHGPASEWLKRLPDDHLDWAYIDSDHSYDGARSDLNLLWPKMKDGGWLAGHDYCPELFPGLVQAVDEFCTQHGQEIAVLTDELPVYAMGRPGEYAFNSFAIRVQRANARLP